MASKNQSPLNVTVCVTVCDSVCGDAMCSKRMPSVTDLSRLLLVRPA